jgi:hypothetical protein
MSPQEATSYVTSTNNFLMPKENAEILPSVPITYKNQEYWVVAAVSGNTVNAYIPINNDTKLIATGDIETRRLIDAGIILRQTQQYKTQNSLNWHFSISNRNYFYDLSNSFSEMISKVISVRTELLKDDETKELANLAEDVEEDLQEMITNSQNVASIINDSIDFENKMLSSPDANNISDYEKLNNNFFKTITDYKTTYDSLNLSLNSLKQGIGLADSITLQNRNAMNQNLNLPTQTAKLSSFFNEIDSINQNMQEIFSLTTRTDTYVATLNTRILRNEAWWILYSTDEDILKINSRFKTLEEAAENILSEENVMIWIKQDDVEALRLNWTQAKSRYDSARYETAINSGKNAKKNVIEILKEGVKTEENEIPEGLIINIIIILIIVAIGLFVYENFLKKKKENEEIMYEPEY